MADPPFDPLRSKRSLVVAVPLAPFGRPVRVSDGHAYDGDGGVDATERDDPGNPPTRAHDDLAADLLTQDAVRGSDVVRSLGCDRRRLEPESVLPDCGGGVMHHRVRRRATMLERQVEPRELDVDPRDVSREHTQRLVEQFLAGLVSFEDDERRHGRDPTGPYRVQNRWTTFL